MITGDQLAIAIAAVLIAAVAVGWCMHWLWLRLSKRPVSAADRITEMANRMHYADRARESAEAARVRAETQLAERLAELQAEITQMEERHAVALLEAKVDAETSMDGLRLARQRIAELEEQLDAAHAGTDP